MHASPPPIGLLALALALALLGPTTGVDSSPRGRRLHTPNDGAVAAPAVPPASLPTSFTHASLASPLIYIHIAKTGGMSLRKALYSSVFGNPNVVTVIQAINTKEDLVMDDLTREYLNQAACAVSLAPLVAGQVHSRADGPRAREVKWYRTGGFYVSL